nr:HAMP domain-containing sensor histidine kinase [Streptomyces sp. SID5468]
MPLRSRLALLTALAVAVAVAAAVFACWFITRAELLRGLDNQLKGQEFGPRDYQQVCGSAPGYVPSPYTVRVLQGDGTVCAFANRATLPVTKADVDVLYDGRAWVAYDTKDSRGTPVRVVTRPIPFARDAVLSVAAPLSQVNDPLGQLAVILAVVGGVGVLGSATAGLGIARAGLRPVDRLADAVEHVARTEDLTVRIPVEGENEDEIARLTTAFNSMTARLASSRERQQQLIADAGHELRTPLTSLRTNIELLARSEETGRPIPAEDRKALMASVKAQMTELALLIGDLQELSRPEAVPGSEPTQIVAVHEVAGQAVRRARLRGPDLVLETVLEPWYVRAEPASLERALVNLLDNAVKFSPSGGTVEVRLRRGEFTVRDHGPGIPAEDLPHVFERFWRSPSARSLPGSGLGLSIVARTVAQLGGAVALHPAKGGGTVAVVSLPGTPVPPAEHD